MEEANIIVDTTKINFHIFEGPMGATAKELEAVENRLAFEPELGMWVLDGGTFPYLNVLIMNLPAPVNHKWSRWD